MKQKLIYTRLPDEDDGGYLKNPGCLITDNMAFAILDDQLEIHIIAATNDPDEYDMVMASNPLFHVGDDISTVIADVHRLSLIEFAKKYVHPDFKEDLIRCTVCL